MDAAGALPVEVGLEQGETGMQLDQSNLDLVTRGVMTSSRGPMFASRPVKHRSCELEMGEAGLWTEGVVAVVQIVGNVGVW